MVPFRKILFPVDFSPACSAMAPYVSDMQQRNQAQLILLHVNELPRVDSTEFPMFPPEPRAEIEEIGRHRLQIFQEKHFPQSAALNLLEGGEPGTAIEATATTHDVDLIMMPTHGRGLFRRFLLGSVTAKVLHDLDRPLWTDAHLGQSEDRPHLPCRSIVCAIEFDSEDAGVIRSAGALARIYDAQLAVCNSVEWPAANFAVDFHVYKQEVVETGLQRLIHEAGVDASVCVYEGHPAVGVQKAITEANADLLVLGRGHAQNAVSRLWSNLYTMIRESPCPVISF